MITEVVMERKIFGGEIRQKSKSEFFSATDLSRVGNDWRRANKLDPFNMNTWFNQKGTKDFISELEKTFGKIKINSTGKGKHTWIHPFLFIDKALAISPKLKIEVYQWLYDSLLEYRNDSGDSFKKMSGALFNHTKVKSQFVKDIQKQSLKVRDACGVEDWQTATSDQLKLRDKIHNNIALLCDVLLNNDDAVRIGIEKALEEER